MFFLSDLGLDLNITVYLNSFIFLFILFRFESKFVWYNFIEMYRNSVTRVNKSYTSNLNSSHHLYYCVNNKCLVIHRLFFLFSFLVITFEINKRWLWDQTLPAKRSGSGRLEMGRGQIYYKWGPKNRWGISA